MTAGIPGFVLHERELVIDADDVHRIRSYVVARFSRRARLARLEVDEVVNEVVAHVLRAQQRPASRWNPDRGSSWDGYLFQLACSGAENAFRRPRRWSVEVMSEEEPDQVTAPTAGHAREVEDALDLLDTDEERTAAVLMAQGCTAAEMSRAMGLGAIKVAELRARVRVVLGVLR